MRDLFKLKLAENDGAGEAGTAESSADATTVNTTKTTETDGTTDITTGSVIDNIGQKDTGEEEEVPTYFSQLSKDRAEKYKGSLSKYKSLNEVADALSSLTENTKNSIKIPTKDSSKEDKIAFVKALGIPTSKDEYKIDIPKEYDDETGQALKDSIIDKALKSGMTNKQAQLTFNEILTYDGLIKKNIADKIKSDTENLMSRLDAEYAKSYQVKSERTEAINGDAKRVNSFLKETGLANEFKDSNLLTNPKVIMAIAGYMKKISSGSNGVDPSKTGTGSDTKKSGLTMSDQFNKMYGGKR